MKYPFLDLEAENRPLFSELTAAANRVITSGQYIGGPEVDAFESELAATVSTDYAVGVSNGLDALRLGLTALITLGRLQPGDEVIIPANTYIASALAVIHAGLTPVAADVEPDTLLLSAESVEQHLTPRTRTIMPVHLYGRVCWNSRLAEIARCRHLIIIEDAAQAIGATSAYPGLTGSYNAGAIGHLAAFSFYPTKNIGALGDGGAVTTSSPEIAETVRTLANYGSRERGHHLLPGYNCRLDPIQAAMLRVKLPHLAEISERRRAVAATYTTLLSSSPLLLPPPDPGCVWHQYVVQLPDPDMRKPVRDALLREGVVTDIHYPSPVHRQPCYPATPLPSPLPVAEAAAERIISLPIGLPTTPESASEISTILLRCLQ